MAMVNLIPDTGWQDRPSALIVAHPGHEVRLHGWLGLAQPRVLILSDGSGRLGPPRLGATTEYLASLEIEPGTIYGQYPDRELYQHILDHDFDFFIRLADELAKSVDDLAVRFIVGDAAEGYNPIHDICRLLIDASVEMLAHDRGQTPSFDYAVVNKPDDCPRELVDKSFWLQLDDDTFAGKLLAARTFYPELWEEFQNALDPSGTSPMKEYFDLSGQRNGVGFEAFRVECLRPCVPVSASNGKARSKPFYEVHGERQVAAGLYDQVIRYEEHIAPIAERLRRHVQ